MTIKAIYEERLEATRARIKILRDALADPTNLSDVSIDGVSERVPRADLVRELKQLEADELDLLHKMSGVSSRVFRVELK